LQQLASSLPPNADVVEVGSWAGEGALIFLSSGVRRLIMVDPFDPLLCGRRPGRAASAKRVALAEEKLSRTVLARWPNASLLKMYSVDAARHLAGQRFDMVYIDADHAEASVRQDIDAWRSLVKPGGLLAGHDYTGGYLGGVRRAVDALLGKPDVVYEDTSWAKRMGTHE